VKKETDMGPETEGIECGYGYGW